MEGTRRLVLVRHAKAEEYSPGRRDFERDLTERGRADAAEAARWMVAEGIEPTTAYVSGAVRARATWAAMAEAASWSCEPVVDSLLYSTDEYGVLEIVHATAEDVDTVVVVGHNPTIGVLGQMLDDGEAPSELSDQMLGGVPTSAVIVYDVPGPWSELAAAGARLKAFHVGRVG